MEYTNNRSLVTTSSKQLGTTSSETSIDKVIRSDHPVFQTIAKTQKDSLVEIIAAHMIPFIQNNFPSTPNPISVANEFSTDIVQQRPDWRIPEIKIFINFIKSNISLEEVRTLGNMITPLKLHAFANNYEEERANAREKKVAEHKINDRFLIESAHEPHVKKYIDWIKETFEKAEQEAKKVVYTGNAPIIHNALNPITSLEHFTQLTALIPEFNEEEKQSWKEQIEKLNPSTESEVTRMMQLLELLK